MLAFIAVCVVKAADPATCFFPSSSRRRNLYTPEKREVRFSATYRQPKYYNPSPRGLSRVLRAIARISVNFRCEAFSECKNEPKSPRLRRVSGIVRIIDRDFAIIFDVDKKILNIVQFGLIFIFRYAIITLATKPRVGSAARFGGIAQLVSAHASHA